MTEAREKKGGHAKKPLRNDQAGLIRSKHASIVEDCVQNATGVPATARAQLQRTGTLALHNDKTCAKSTKKKLNEVSYSRNNGPQQNAHTRNAYSIRPGSTWFPANRRLLFALKGALSTWGVVQNAVVRAQYQFQKKQVNSSTARMHIS